MTPTNVADLLFSTVVDEGYCIGCGACASVVDSPVEMRMDDFGQYRPFLRDRHSRGDAATELDLVCPFSERALDEDALAEENLGDMDHDWRVGKYMDILAGHVEEGTFRRRGSSGGFTSWILAELLERKLIDGVIHVTEGPDTEEEPLFRYGVSDDLAAVVKGAKSRYYPVEFSQAVSILRERPGRYAFVGVPCFVKAMRLLAHQDELVKASVRFGISIFCGHGKSAGFAESYAWQMGIHPDELGRIDFRVKNPDAPANLYRVSAAPRAQIDRRAKEVPNSELFGADWGLGFFKPKACDFCDDIAGETADVSLGDAWLPEFVGDGGGSNIIIIRNPVIANVIREGMDRGAIRCERLGPERIFDSQAGNYRHRREGLAFRLHEVDRAGGWRPPKRIAPRADHIPARRKRLYRLRSIMSEASHIAFRTARQKDDFAYFKRTMAPYVRKHEKLRRSMLRQIWWRWFRPFFGRIRNGIKNGLSHRS